MLPLSQQLQLLPRFAESRKSTLAPSNPAKASTFFTNPSEGPTVVDTNSLIVTLINKGKEVTGTIVDGGSGVNVIIRRTCDTLGIQEWESCPFWLRMVDTSSVRPTGLIRNLEITIEGHAFWISTVMLQLNISRTYPLLLGRPWLKMAHIKQNWQNNIISFQCGKTKVRVPTQEQAGTSKQLTLLFTEGINILDRVADEKVDQYLEENPKIV